MPTHRTFAFLLALVPAFCAWADEARRRRRRMFGLAKASSDF